MLGFYDNNTFFDATLAERRGYYRFLIRLKAALPNGANKLQSAFKIIIIKHASANNINFLYKG